MAFFKVDSFQKINTVGTQTIPHGLGVVPKAIIFFTCGANGIATWAGQIVQVVGFTAGPTNSYAVAGGSQDAVGTSNTARRMAAKALTIVWPVGDLVEEADLQSWDATNFTLNWTLDQNAANDLHIGFLAIGGDEVEAKVLSWTTPTAVGNKVVTGLDWKPDLALHAFAGNENAVLPFSLAGMLFGFGVMNKHGQQWANSVYSQDAAAVANTSRYQQTDAAFVGVGTTEALSFQAHYVSMDYGGTAGSGGFTMNFANTAASGPHPVITLCLKNVSSKIGAFAKTIAVAPAAQPIERVGFQPKAVLVSSTGLAAAGAPATGGYFRLGATDGTNQRAAAQSDVDAADPMQADSIFASDATVIGGSNGVTFDKASISLTTDGFSATWNPNSTGAGDVLEHLYLALGDAGVDTFPSRVG